VVTAYTVAFGGLLLLGGRVQRSVGLDLTINSEDRLLRFQQPGVGHASIVPR